MPIAKGTCTQPRSSIVGHLTRPLPYPTPLTASKGPRMQSQTPGGAPGAATPASGPGGGAGTNLQQLKAEDPSFATLSTPSGGKEGVPRAPAKGSTRTPSGDGAAQRDHSKLDDLKSEDPAFATLRTEDAIPEAQKPPPQGTPAGSGDMATAEAPKSPPSRTPAAERGIKPAAPGDSSDSLAQDLERLQIGKSSEQAKEEEGKTGLATVLLQQVKKVLGKEVSPAPEKVAEPEPLLQSFDLVGIAHLIKKGGAKKMIFMIGAGVSVSAGIPDFRTPGTGLYDNLQKFNLPYPEAVFSLDYFRKKPMPFYQLAKELFPGSFKPTPAHYFMMLLHKKGLLLRCFTQNIDSLETQAGLPAEKVVFAHGNFETAHCIDCKAEVPQQAVRAAVDAANPCRCSKCNGLVKPDIVFFGEGLPVEFFQRLTQDFPAADLLVVMGSSLVVQPFASLIGQVEDKVPRLLINRERVAEGGGGFDFDARKRDCLFLGDCDEGVRRLASLLGWREELEEMITSARSATSPI